MMHNEVKTWNEIVGCIHIHSVYSDGTGTIPEIAGIAGEAELDYIMITDHNNLRALLKGEEGWYDSILAVIGYEINDINDANHYLAFGLDQEIERNLPAREYVKRVQLNGGFGIIAHPDERRDLMLEHPPYPWTDWDISEYQGIEIWNQMSEWMEGLTPWNKLWRFINPRRSIIAPESRTLERWDLVNKKRKVVGIGGVDAHAHKHKFLGGLIEVTVFRYKVQFQTVRTHLLTPQKFNRTLEVSKAKDLIYDALLNCRTFVSNFFNGDARNFRIFAENDAGRITIGGILPFHPHTVIKVNLPAKAQTRLIHDGKLIGEKTGINIEFPIDQSGLYRVEVFRNKRAWIYSNHLRIGSDA